MTIAIEVLDNPYAANGGWCADKPWSVRVPHHLSGFYMYQAMDGDQPCYENIGLLESLLHYAGVTEFDTVADYPRDGNTLRFMFHRIIDATTASHVFNLVNDIKGSNQ